MTSCRSATSRDGPGRLRNGDNGAGQLGNRVSSLFVHLPVSEPDPVRRYLVTAGETAELKAGGEARTSAELLALAGLAPPLLHSVLARSTTESGSSISRSPMSRAEQAAVRVRGAARGGAPARAARRGSTLSESPW